MVMVTFKVTSEGRMELGSQSFLAMCFISYDNLRTPRLGAQNQGTGGAPRVERKMCWANVLGFQSKKAPQELWSNVLPSSLWGDPILELTRCIYFFFSGLTSNYLAIFKGRDWGRDQKQCGFHLLVNHPFSSPSVIASPHSLKLLHFLN